MTQTLNIFWFRRDLRLDDNIGFYNALKQDLPVLPIFIFDSEILDDLPEDDARVEFIYNTLQDMRKPLRDDHDSGIAMYHGKPEQVFKKLIKNYKMSVGDRVLLTCLRT